ncbi:uncharacterized protein LOC120170011 isoform X1 [Hibiscus syriacus]|uniref:uncharacterized protein LOC120170011 isoform X1 n=1 Tax=Hibiscus syriacus TaxID=106335 RepID=UPI001920F906|nr:uncharacterized protein LOC120170011 isoform X1 [Hibiscus syriacus]
MEMLTIFSASRHHNFFSYSISTTLNSDSPQVSIPPLKLHPLLRSLPVRLRSISTTRAPRCISAAPRPPPPPESDSPVKIPLKLVSRQAFSGVLMVLLSGGTGLVGKLYRFKDRAWIFFAVLFWLSLFFWYSAWDGRNSDKGSRFRK